MSDLKFLSKKNNISHNGKYYVLFDFVYKYLTPTQLLQMGIDDYADIINEREEEKTKILHLTLKKKWFDLIASGEKKNEYREDKPYWSKRLLNDDESPKDFDVVCFRNGYAKDAPELWVELKGMSFSGSRWMSGEHGEELPESFIILELGEVFRSLAGYKASIICPQCDPKVEGVCPDTTCERFTG